MPLSGKVGAVFVQTADAPVSFSEEATTGSLDRRRFTISDAAKRYWDKDTPVTVKVNSVVVSAGFTLEHCGGVVVFEAPLELDDEVTVSGKYLTVAQHGGFFNWSAELELETSDITTFQSAGWKENLATVKGFTASAERYWGDEEFFAGLGKEVVIALYTDATASKQRYEGFGIISSDGIETAVDDIVNETIELQGTGPLHYREG
ncbi:hypothetical protein [Zhaonella formicivorans]|uniref:hypothetical protein n=1 Tax=Zhaonella formicivorans TaxID=2528593 RepID=UPI001D111949|nr:hypothetical protein [Zhaonella formicivorans]